MSDFLLLFNSSTGLEEHWVSQELSFPRKLEVAGECPSDRESSCFQDKLLSSSFVFLVFYLFVFVVVFNDRATICMCIRKESLKRTIWEEEYLGSPRRLNRKLRHILLTVERKCSGQG